MSHPKTEQFKIQFLKRSAGRCIWKIAGIKNTNKPGTASLAVSHIELDLLLSWVIDASLIFWTIKSVARSFGFQKFWSTICCVSCSMIWFPKVAAVKRSTINCRGSSIFHVGATVLTQTVARCLHLHRQMELRGLFFSYCFPLTGEFHTVTPPFSFLTTRLSSRSSSLSADKTVHELCVYV